MSPAAALLDERLAPARGGSSLRRSRVLVVEDDESTQEFYRHFFEKAHRGDFEWALAGSAERALTLLRAGHFDVVVLDWSLPRMQGIDFLLQLKDDPATYGLAVFMVTSRSNVEDCVLALESGCDDFMVKPFEPDELRARLGSILRRSGAAPEPRVLRLDDLELDEGAAKVTVGGKHVRLFPKELELLSIFMRRPDMIHATAFLWDAVWGYDSANRDNVLGVTISSLRKKLGPKWGPRLEAQRGRGYILASGR